MSKLVSRLVLLAGAAGLLLPTSTALAQAKKAQAKKAKPACGIYWLPLAVGNEWTYDYIPPPPPKEGEPEQLPLVFPPKAITIKVLSVTPPKKGKKKAPTEIVLEETTDKLVRKTTLRCTKTYLEVSPQSFFFAGEPGGGTRVELTNEHRTGKSFPGVKGFKRGMTNELTLTAGVKRESARKSLQLDPVNLSITRTLSFEGPQKVIAPAGEFPRALRIKLEVSGKVKLNNKETLFPRNVPGALWLVKGLGVVQSYNTLGQQYRLNRTSIVFKKKKGR